MSEPGTRVDVWRRSGRGVAVSLALAAVLQSACAAPPSREPRRIPFAPATESLRAGLALYAADEFARAGEQFRDAASAARAIGDRDLAHRATIAECTSWLRARRMSELCGCAETLSDSQRRRRSSDPRVNTLISLAALAGGGPLPPVRTPSAVRVVLRSAAEGR